MQKLIKEPTSIPDLRKLPIFQIVGGEENERITFQKQLFEALDGILLCGYVARSKNLNVSRLLAHVRQYDLVIVERVNEFDVQEIVLTEEPEPGTLSYSWKDSTSMDVLIDKLVARLETIILETPLWACVLIGGKSSRMGQPKHLIPTGDGKKTWLEQTVQQLENCVDGVVISGAGEVSNNLSHVPRLVDIPGVVGPMSGILAATRWQPMATWLVVACDMPNVSQEAFHWLLSHRRAGSWGRVPRLIDSEYCEPLLAWYDFRAAQIFEEQLLRDIFKVSQVASHFKVDNPLVPESIQNCWQNVNTPEQLESIREFNT